MTLRTSIYFSERPVPIHQSDHPAIALINDQGDCRVIELITLIAPWSITLIAPWLANQGDCRVIEELIAWSPWLIRVIELGLVILSGIQFQVQLRTLLLFGLLPWTSSRPVHTWIRKWTVSAHLPEPIHYLYLVLNNPQLVPTFSIFPEHQPYWAHRFGV